MKKQAVGQPVLKSSTDHKVKNQNWMVVVLLILFLSTSGIAGYYRYQNHQIKKELEKEEQPQVSSVSKENSPEDNVLYLGTYHGDDAVYYTNSFLRNQNPKSNDHTGYIVLSDNLGGSSFDFRNLQSPRAIYKLQESKELVVDRLGMGFIFDLDKDYLYLPVIFHKTLTGGNTLYTNKIYRLSTRGDKSEELWSHELGDNGDNNYPQKWDASISDIVMNDFLVISLACCLTEPLEPREVLILNISSRKEKYLGAVGDVELNLSDKVVYYRKLIPDKIPCWNRPECDANNRRIVYRPSGEILTVNLP